MKEFESRYYGYRYPPEVISHAVTLCDRELLSFREAEALLDERGVAVSYETIRQWCEKFGSGQGKTAKKRLRYGTKWSMDAADVTICGEEYCLWRALDQRGNLLDILAQPRRNRRTAESFLKKSLKDG
ncbi:MAG: putative transposase [Hyphomicrobiaceae bacterium]|jgi:putative transposase